MTSVPSGNATPDEVRTWRRIWRSRQAGPGGTTRLAGLLASDGYDNEFGRISEDAWRAMVRHWMTVLGVRPGMTIYEIGCGSGAFLHDFYQLGCPVGGLDLSESLISRARSVMPGGSFRVADAGTFDGRDRADIVAACGVFMYFPSQEYAQMVLTAMARAARHAVLVLDLPDRDKKDAATASRIAAMGGRAEYERRYRGLDHCYYERADLTGLLTAAGYRQVGAEDVRIEGYSNAPFRFDLYGLRTRLT